MDFATFGPVISPAITNVPHQQRLWQGCFAGADEFLGLPAGFPSRVSGASAWSGSQLHQDTTFIHQLSDVDVTEINVALGAFKCLELDGDAVNCNNFPLPTLGPKLVRIARDLYHGKGFSVIRGVDPKDYSVEYLTIIWLGVQAYIADQRGSQDHKGNMLVHIVADSTTEARSGHHRHSTSAITFHNEEAGDVVAWLTRSTAASGGRCIISSVHSVYNVLSAHRPDIIRTLAKSDWPFALPRFQCRPVLFHHEGKLMMNFGRTPLLGNATHPRPDHLPRVNDRQREALDLIEAVAQAGQLEIQTQPGDMHFINNLIVLHRREGFVDGQVGDTKRHLVRMRLRNSELGCDMPAELEREWYDAFNSTATKTWHLELMPGDAFPLRKYTN